MKRLISLGTVVLALAAVQEVHAVPASNAIAATAATPQLAIQAIPNPSVVAPDSLAPLTLTITAAPARLTTVPEITVPTRTATLPQRSQGPVVPIATLIGLALFAGSLRTVAADNNSYSARDTVRQQYNTLASWIRYRTRNAMISTTTATFPGIAKGAGNTKPKSANNTVLLNAGAVNAFAAADNAWTLTGAALAASSYRKYLLLADASDVCTVLASSDASTDAGCVYPNVPADGLAIVGSITVATDASHTFTPNTTNLDASGITTTYFDGFGDDAVFPFVLVTL